MDIGDIVSIPIGLSYEKAATKREIVVTNFAIPKIPLLRQEVRIILADNMIKMLDMDNAKQVEEIKEKCGKCKRDCYISILKRNAGICGLCTPKPQKISPKPQVQKLSFKPIIQLDKSGKQEVDDPSSPKTATAAAALNKNNGDKITKSNKVECPSCKVKFTEQTLKRNGGTCGKCAKSKQDGTKGATGATGATGANTSPVRKTSPKSPCPQCGTEYSPVTLKKYGGLCRACHNK